MSIISWNCQGAAGSETRHALRRLIQNYKPDILFLMETKNHRGKMEALRYSMGFECSHYFPSDGIGGGLALWWYKDWSVTVLQDSPNFIDTVINCEHSPSPSFVTFVYGDPYRSGRRSVWQDIGRLRNESNISWCCIGDFNAICDRAEKDEGNNDTQFINLFNEFMNDNALIQLDIVGADFSWSNNRVGDQQIRQRVLTS